MTKRQPLLNRLVQALAIFTNCLAITRAQFSDDALWPLQTYKSSSIKTPFMNVTKMGQTEPGLLFISPHDMIRGETHPAIYSDDGQLVWQGIDGNYTALQPQVLDGEPVIAYWEGFTGSGFGFGHISIMNSSYDEIHRVTLSCKDQNFVTSYDPMSFDSCIDLHEIQFTKNGSILVTAVNVTQADLTSVGGPKDGWIQDGLIYEIEIKTDKILFRWSAHEHRPEAPMSYNWAPIGVVGAGSGVNKTDPYGYPHLNSIDKYGDNYLLSSRYMCSVFFIASNGSIIWHLHGQTGGDFHLGLGTSFCYQHDVRFESQSPERVRLSMHNNDNAEFTGHASLTTGLVLNVELQGSKEVTVHSRMWDAADPVYAESQGSYQVLENGHFLQGHGAIPKIEEYDENGTIVMRARFGHDNTMQSYRAFRYPWIGRPSTIPRVVACLSNESKKTAVYISWNGATDVESWKVYSGSRVKQTSKKNGFETIVLIDGLSGSDSVVVEAVGGVSNGRRSQPATVGEGC